MRKAIVISFFQSPNLGDLALSHAICERVEGSGFELALFDFCTAEFIATGTKRSPKRVVSGPEAIISFKNRLNTGLANALSRILGPVRAAAWQLPLQKQRRKSKWMILEKEFLKADVIVMGGGNMVMDIVPSWPARFREFANFAYRYHKPLYVMWVGIGPIQHRYSWMLFRSALRHATGISVRDSHSKKLCLQMADPEKVVQSADPVFGLNVERKADRLATAAQIKRETPIKVGVCVLGSVCFQNTQEHARYLESLEILIRMIASKHPGSGLFTLFSTETFDYPAVQILHSKLKGAGLEVSVMDEFNSLESVCTFYKTLHALVGGRMHAMIIAHLCLLPHIGVIWQEKIGGYGGLTGMQNRMFTVDEVAQNTDKVAESLLFDSGDFQLISRMYKTNGRLRDLVSNGNILTARSGDRR